MAALGLFQAQVAGIFGEAGATLGAIEELPARDGRIRLAIEADASFEQLHESLSRLEREAPYALVETLALRRRSVGLSIQLEIAAFLRIGDAGRAVGASGAGGG